MRKREMRGEGESARERRRLSIILRNNFEARAETDLASFSKLSAPSCFILSRRLPSCSFLSLSLSFYLFLDLVLRLDTAAGDKFQIPVVLLVTVPEKRAVSYLLCIIGGLHPSPAPCRRSGDVVLVHSYFGTNIMLIPIAMHPSRADVCPCGRTKHRCCMPMVIDG